MPQVQVLDFNQHQEQPDPIAGFTKSFLGTLEKKREDRRNNSIFERIKNTHGPDASPEDIFRSVMENDELAPDYKSNKLSHIKDYAAISNSSQTTKLRNAEYELKKKKADATDAEKPITPFQKKDLALKKRRLEVLEAKAKNAVKNASKKLPEYVNKYTSALLKEADTKLPAHDKADLNGFIEQLLAENEDLSINEAFNHANEYIEARRERIENGEITPRPSSWFGDNPQQVESALEQAYAQLKAYHDEDGITNQSELRKIAERGGWKKEEVTAMMKRIFQGAGKKLRGPKPKEPSAQKSAQIPFNVQGQASQAAGVDDILFGE